MGDNKQTMIIDSIKFLESTQNNFMLEYFNEIANMANVYGVFNPSFVFSKNIKAVSFRAIPYANKNKKLTSYFCVDSGHGPEIQNLSEAWTSYLNCPRLIDPKIFSLKEDIYITFNSGYVKGGNDIFVMKIYPNIECPKKISYKGRQTQERNWSFFTHENDIYALYWVDPLRILKLEKSTDKQWHFVDYYKGDLVELYDQITLGTQLCYFKGKCYFIGHIKGNIDRRKAYLGKLFNFDFINKNVEPHDGFMAHSFDSLFGVKNKSNKNLFSCTYFSGLNILNDNLLAGYGVNDIDLGFSLVL